jgi:NAD(P)-dependent dehydrogenase (short-subunit alcohol dehydrogenase family)
MESDSDPVALITGASRGIGKAVAVHLARSGFKVALAARTMEDGEEREHSSTVKASDTSPLPGSLAATTALVEEEGGIAIPVYLDITNRATISSAVAQVQEQWGRIDVLVNNARYVGPGHMDRFLDTPIELLDEHLEGNVMAPVILARLVLPGMIERRRGCVITITSRAGIANPPAPAGEGGWGLGYALSKGAVCRLAGVIDVEHRQDGIRAFNLNPGTIRTERIAQDMKAFGFDADAGASPDLIGAAAAWLATSKDADALLGQWVEGQELCAEHGLIP